MAEHPTAEERFKVGQVVLYYPIGLPAVSASVLGYSANRVRIRVTGENYPRRRNVAVAATSLSDVNG